MGVMVGVTGGITVVVTVVVTMGVMVGVTVGVTVLPHHYRATDGTIAGTTPASAGVDT